MVLAVAAAAAGTRTVRGPQPLGLSAGRTQVQLLQTPPGKPEGRFHLERARGVTPDVTGGCTVVWLTDSSL